MIPSRVPPLPGVRSGHLTSSGALLIDCRQNQGLGFRINLRSYPQSGAAGELIHRAKKYHRGGWTSSGRHRLPIRCRMIKSSELLNRWKGLESGLSLLIYARDRGERWISWVLQTLGSFGPGCRGKASLPQLNFRNSSPELPRRPAFADLFYLGAICSDLRNDKT